MDTSLKNRAYEHIRSELMAGRLRPGERLSNRGMAEEIGVSVIPVREAMAQLVSEGLLEHRPKVGTFVIEPSRQELAELCELREALETYAVRKAATRIGDEDLAELKRHAEEMAAVVDELSTQGTSHWSADQADRWNLADAGFHMTLLRAAGNRRALRTVADLRLMTLIFGHQDAARRVERVVHACREHQDILGAVERHDADAARDMMEKHLRRGTEVAVEVYERGRMEEAGKESSEVRFPTLLRERIHEIEQEPERGG